MKAIHVLILCIAMVCLSSCGKITGGIEGWPIDEERECLFPLQPTYTQNLMGSCNNGTAVKRAPDGQLWYFNTCGPDAWEMESGDGSEAGYPDCSDLTEEQREETSGP